MGKRTDVGITTLCALIAVGVSTFLVIRVKRDIKKNGAPQLNLRSLKGFELEEVLKNEVLWVEI